MKTNNKTTDEIKDRIGKLVQNSVKGTWTPEEDNLIIRYYEKFGRNWALIAKKVKGRSGK